VDLTADVLPDYVVGTIAIDVADAAQHPVAADRPGGADVEPAQSSPVAQGPVVDLAADVLPDDVVSAWSLRLHTIKGGCAQEQSRQRKYS
jgi:hypothetical protein